MTPRPPSARRRLTEAQLHRAVADYLAVALPESACFTTFPAGGGGKVRGAQLKSRGLRAGWPDVQVLYRFSYPDTIHPRSQFVGLELKTATGRLSPEQIECHAAIRRAGGLVFVCRSVEDVESFLSGLGIPLRARPFGLGTVRRAA